MTIEKKHWSGRPCETHVDPIKASVKMFIAAYRQRLLLYSKAQILATTVFLPTLVCYGSALRQQCAPFGCLDTPRVRAIFIYICKDLFHECIHYLIPFYTFVMINWTLQGEIILLHDLTLICYSLLFEIINFLECK